PSCPSTAGIDCGIVPSTSERSEWHTPLAAIRTRTRPGPGGSSSTSSIVSGSCTARSTAPFITFPPARRSVKADGHRVAATLHKSVARARIRAWRTSWSWEAGSSARPARTSSRVTARRSSWSTRTTPDAPPTPARGSSHPRRHCRRRATTRSSRWAISRHADVLVDVAPDDACAMFPPLAGVRAAYFNPRGARVDGRAMAAALVHGAGARGVQWQHARASRVRVDHARVTAVETVDGDELACGTVVVAGGAWTPEIARSLGCDVAVRPQRGQIVHLRVDGDGAGDTARWPVLQPVLSHYVVPWPDGRVALGATMEEVGFDSRPTVGGIRQLLSEGLRLAL